MINIRFVDFHVRFLEMASQVFSLGSKSIEYASPSFIKIDPDKMSITYPGYLLFPGTCSDDASC
jgi:hypothetical protein